LKRLIDFVSSVGHAIFLLVSTLVVLGCLVQFRGGEPLTLFEAIPVGLHPSGALTHTIDFAAMLIIAALGCVIAWHGGRWNVAAEGQVIFGYCCTAWICHHFGFALGGAGSVFFALVGSAAVGAVFACLTLGYIVPIKRGQEVLYGLVFNGLAIVAALHSSIVVSGTMQPLLFPLVSSASGPCAGIVLAAIAVLAVRQCLLSTWWGLELRALDRLEHEQGRRASIVPLVCGALSGLAGALAALSGYGVPYGLGYLAIASLTLAGTRQFGLLVIVCFLLAAADGGWSLAARQGLGTSALAAGVLVVGSSLGAQVLREGGGSWSRGQ